MKKIIMPIDTKSLFLNIKNDNLSGHTATVSTAIKQGNSVNEKLQQIYRIPKQIDFKSKPDLINELIKNSKSQISINNVFCFDKISVNGMLINVQDKNFCIYIKEEIDPEKARFGRIKMHYPINLNYEDADISIDNRYIINLMSDCLKNYAFIVNSFEYDFDDDILNFKVTIVGENNIPYSKIFINNKGVGNKYNNIFNEMADSYDMEIISLRKQYGAEVNPDNYNMYYTKLNDKAYDLIKENLERNGKYNINVLGELYHYSLYDIDYVEDGVTKYIQLYFTSTRFKYFNISSKRLQFMSDFQDNSKIFLITSIADKPVINEYVFSDIMNFSKSINSLMLKDGE